MSDVRMSLLQPSLPRCYVCSRSTNPVAILRNVHIAFGNTADVQICQDCVARVAALFPAADAPQQTSTEITVYARDYECDLCSSRPAYNPQGHGGYSSTDLCAPCARGFVAAVERQVAEGAE